MSISQVWEASRCCLWNAFCLVEHPCLRAVLCSNLQPAFLFASDPPEADITEEFKACSRWTRQPCTDCTSTPGSCCLLDLSLSQQASFCVAGCYRDRFEQCLLCLTAGSPIPLPLWSDRAGWRGKYQEAGRKPEISLKGSEASCGAPDVSKTQSIRVGRKKKWA